MASSRNFAGIDKALEMLRNLPRVTIGNLKSNPGAFKKVWQYRCRKLNFDNETCVLCVPVLKRLFPGQMYLF